MEQKFGLFSPYTLKFHEDQTKQHSGTLLKRSFILFDEMVYIQQRKKDSGFLELALAEGDNRHLPELIQYFKPVEDFIDEDYLGDVSFTPMDGTTNMYYSHRTEIYKDFIRRYLTKTYGFDAFNVKSAQEFEILDFYVSALSADVHFLLNISKKENAFSALYTSLHRDAYFATFDQKQEVVERVLDKVCSLKYFDFANLTWKQILELRNSHFLKDFRKKFQEWLAEFNRGGSENEFEQKIGRFLNDSTFEFISRHKPNMGEQITTAIIENIPTPFSPLISIYSSFLDIQNAYLEKEKFGWLFFVQEAIEKERTNNSGLVVR